MTLYKGDFRVLVDWRNTGFANDVLLALDRDGAVRVWSTGGERLASEDIVVAITLWYGITATEDRVYIVGGSGAQSVRSFDHQGNEVPSEGFGLPAVAGAYTGIAAAATRLLILHKRTTTPTTVQAWGYDGVRHASEDITLDDAANSYSGIAVTNDHMYTCLAGTGVEVYTRSGVRQPDLDIEFDATTSQFATGVAVTSTRIYVVASLEPSIQQYHIRVWLLNGMRLSSEDITLPASTIFLGLTSTPDTRPDAGADDDVTRDLTLLDIAFGGSPEANPERPVLRPGFGRLALTGSKYIAGRPGSLSDAQLRVRHLIEVRYDAVPLWRGWAQEPRRQNVRVGGDSVSWKLEGLLSQGLRNDVTILNNEGSSRDADTLATWAAAVGADPPTLVNVPPVDLSLYNFMGLGGRYVSEFARVAGGFPVARRDGSVALVSSSMGPASPDTLSQNDYVLTSTATRDAVEHLRNKLELNLRDQSSDTENIGGEPLQRQWNDAQVAAFRISGATFQFSLPVLQEGRTYDAIGLAPLTIEGYVNTVIIFDIGDTSVILGYRYGWVSTADGPNGFQSVTAAVEDDVGGLTAARATVPAAAFDTTFTYTRRAVDQFNNELETATVRSLAFRYRVTFRVVYNIEFPHHRSVERRAHITRRLAGHMGRAPNYVPPVVSQRRAGWGARTYQRSVDAAPTHRADRTHMAAHAGTRGGSARLAAR